MAGWISWSVAVAAAMTASPALAGCEIAKRFELAVTMVDTRPMIDAKINGKDARFLVDSGAFFSTISAGSVAEYGLKKVATPPEFTVSGVGGTQQGAVTRVENFTLQGHDLHNIEFVITGGEVGAVGLLGQNFLSRADIEYDLGHGVIRFFQTKNCKDATLAYWAGNKPVSVMKIDDVASAGFHTVGGVAINGKRLRAIFDTGASTSMLSLAAARRAGIDVNGKGAQPDGYASGLGRKIVRQWLVPVDSFEIEGETIRNTRIRVGDYDPGDGDMLLGIDFFLSHRIYVANSLRKMFFTYDGGPIFNLKPSHVLDGKGGALAVQADIAADPKTADEFSRRGAAFASRQEYARAIADFTRAIELSPDEPRAYLQRARARLAARQPQLAGADLDKTLALAPKDVDARLLRAELRTSRRDRAAAIDDLETLDKAIAPPSDLRLTLGGLFDANEAFDRAIEQYDRWIAAHPEDSKRPTALNGRCWARALAGKDLDRALSDCNAALRARPNTPAYLDSRGLVKLRRGDLDGAVADYDAALAKEPKMAWSLYGRGIARAKKGMAKESAADRAAALAIEPDLAERARGLGITG